MADQPPSAPTASSGATPPAASAAAQPPAAQPPAGTQPLAAPTGAPAAKTDAAPGGADAGKQDAVKLGGDTAAADGAKKEDVTTKLGGLTEEAPAIEVKVPEGVSVDELALNEFKTVMKEIGADSAKAQKVLDLYVKSGKAADEVAKAGFEKQAKERFEALKHASETHKEFGGKDYKTNLKVMQSVVDKFGDPGLSKLFKENPALTVEPSLLRFLWNIGKRMEPDTVAGTVTENGGVHQEEAPAGDHWDRFYAGAKKAAPPVNLHNK